MQGILCLVMRHVRCRLLNLVLHIPLICDQGSCCTGVDPNIWDRLSSAALDASISNSDTCRSQHCSIVVTNSHFYRNSGGAITMDAYKLDPDGDFTATFSTFTNNSGGVLLVSRAIDISNSSFIGNNEHALYSSKFTYLQVSDCAFRNNHFWAPPAMYKEDTAYDWFGGAIYASSTCILPTTPVRDAVWSQRTQIRCVVRLADTEFSGNVAGHKDWPGEQCIGAVHMDLEGFTVFVARCLFARNDAFSKVSVGGTLEVDGGATLLGRKVSTGALHITRSSQAIGNMVYLHGNNFTKNTALVSGAVHLNSASCIAIVNNTFQGNSGGDTGALNIFSPDGHPVMCYDEQPDVFYDFFLVPLFSPTRPVNKTYAGTYLLPGGAGFGDDQYTDKTCNVDIRGSTFNNNKAILHGALFIDTAQHPCGITSSSFTGNLASAGEGGAIYMSGVADLNIATCNFSSNVAFSGGAVCFTSIQAAILVNGSDFDSNSAESSGGGLAVLVGSIATTNTSFVNNTAGSGGGAVLCRDCLEVTTDDSRFFDISAEEYGGAIKISGGAAKDVIMREVNLVGNRYVRTTDTCEGCQCNTTSMVTDYFVCFKLRHHLTTIAISLCCS